MASRTSIHVNSSTKTESSASIGRGLFGSGVMAVCLADRRPTARTTVTRLRARRMVVPFLGANRRFTEIAAPRVADAGQGVDENDRAFRRAVAGPGFLS